MDRDGPSILAGYRDADVRHRSSVRWGAHGRFFVRLQTSSQVLSRTYEHQQSLTCASHSESEPNGRDRGASFCHSLVFDTCSSRQTHARAPRSALDQVSIVAVVAFHSRGRPLTLMRSTVRVPCFRPASPFSCSLFCSFALERRPSRTGVPSLTGRRGSSPAICGLLLPTGPVDIMSSLDDTGYVWGARVHAIITWASPTRPDLRPGMTTSLVPTPSLSSCPSVYFMASFPAGLNSHGTARHLPARGPYCAQ